MVLSRSFTLFPRSLKPTKRLAAHQAETVGVKPRTRPEMERRENMVAVTDKASDLVDAFLANRV